MLNIMSKYQYQLTEEACKELNINKEVSTLTHNFVTGVTFLSHSDSNGYNYTLFSEREFCEVIDSLNEQSKTYFDSTDFEKNELL